MKKILFIERDAYWMNAIGSQFMLKPEYQIEHVSTFVEGMNRLYQGGMYYHAVVMSQNTLFTNEPEQSIVANLKSTNPAIQVIVILDNNNPHIHVNFVQGGAHGVLSKPYSIDAICAEFEKQPHVQYGLNPQPKEVKVGGLHELGENTKPIHEFNPGALDLSYKPEAPSGFNPHGSYIPNPTVPNTGNVYPPNDNPNSYIPNPNFSDPYSQNPHNAGGYNPGNAHYNPQVNGAHVAPSGQAPYGYQAPQESGAPYPQNGPGVVRIRDKTLVAVHSPKGGVGKSTVAKEVAITFAISSFAGSKLKVCLVDMDIENGDVATMLDLKPTKTITEWADNIRHRTGPNGEKMSYSYEEIEKYFLLEHSSGLKVLAAPIAHKDVSKINEEIVEVIYDNLKKYFDIIVVDTGPNIRDFTLISLEKADNVILVADTDVTTINEIAVLRKTLEQMHYPMNKIGMVINNVPPKNQGALNDIVNFLRFPLIGAITRSAMIEDSNNKGNVMVMGKDSSFTVEIKKIANSIIPIVRREPPSRGPQNKRNSQNQSSQRESKSIFKKIFKK